jgi:hypothetical protein
VAWLRKQRGGKQRGKGGVHTSVHKRSRRQRVNIASAWLLNGDHQRHSHGHGHGHGHGHQHGHSHDDHDHHDYDADTRPILTNPAN